MTIHEGIPIGSLKPLELPKTVLPTPKLPELKEPSAEETAAGIARQNRVQAHTVFAVGGEILGVHFADGVTTFKHNFAASAVVGIKEEAARLGLGANEGNDYIASRLEAALEERYGGAVSATRFGPASAPTRGELFSLLFGESDKGGQLTLRA